VVAQLPEFVTARNARADLQLPTLRRFHHLDHFGDGSAHVLPKEQVDRHYDGDEAGQHHHQISLHEITRDHVGARLGDRQNQAAVHTVLLADAGTDNPVSAVRGLDADLIGFRSLELVVVLDAWQAV